MTSREKILTSVKVNKPAFSEIPEISIPVSYEGLIEKYTQVALLIGAKVFEVNSIAEVKEILADYFDLNKRLISSLETFADLAEVPQISRVDPHTLQNVELAIIQAEFGVAENGALWLSEQNLPQRVLPFICQHLAVVVKSQDIVPTLHEPYDRIGNSEYGYGVFIAGPSKSADIEQSLVLGAHGPRSLWVFILANDLAGAIY